MHRIGIRRYAGAPGEAATVRTQPSGSGAVKFVLDGVDHGSTSPFQFNLDTAAGHSSQLSIGLFGAVGETCRVDISTVDGGSDGDLLVAEPHDPFPVHDYTFITLAANSLSQAASFAVTGTKGSTKKKATRKPKGGK